MTLWDLFKEHRGQGYRKQAIRNWSPTMAKLASRNWHGRLVLCRFFSLKPNRYCFGVVGIIRHSISATAVGEGTNAHRNSFCFDTFY